MKDERLDVACKRPAGAPDSFPIMAGCPSLHPSDGTPQSSEIS